MTACLLICAACLIHVDAQAQDTSPTGAHPRIWLTAERLDDLRDYRAQGTEEWRLFEQEYLQPALAWTPEEEDFWTYTMAFLDAIPSLALAYLVSGETVYADKALFFMDYFADRLETEEVSGNDYANSFQNVGLGFDWLYAYEGMTEARKERYIRTMNAAFDFATTPWNQGGGGFDDSSTDSDQIVGDAATNLIWGVATFGDNPRAQELIDHALSAWDTHIRGWIRGSIGGGWPEGSQYNYDTMRYLLELTHAMETALDRDLWMEDAAISDFLPNSLRALRYFTPPSNDHLLRHNDQEDVDAAYWYRTVPYAAHAAYLVDRRGFSTEAAYARHWLREINPYAQHLFYDFHLWRVFLWSEPQKPATSYFREDEPHTYFVDGLGWMLFRSNWTPDATYGSFNATWTRLDHQHADGGHFNIWRRGGYLTQGTRHYDFGVHVGDKVQEYTDGELYNTLLIESDFEEEDEVNASGSQEIFGSVGEAEIVRHRTSESPLFAYAMADLGDAYNLTFSEFGGNSSRVTTYTRQFLYAAPDYFVVFDRVRTEDAGWVRYVLQSPTEPLIQGQLIVQEDAEGFSKLFHRTLFPVDVTLTKVDQRVVWSEENLSIGYSIDPEEKTWHTLVEPAESDRAELLHVAQAADAAVEAMDPTALIASDGSLGAEIGDWVVLFHREETDRTDVQYSVSAAAPLNHLVADLVPGEPYRISVDRTTLGSANSGEHGTVFFQSPAGLDGALFSVSWDPSVTGIEEPALGGFSLTGGYPNPFRSNVAVELRLPTSEHVDVRVYDMLGREIARLVDGPLSPGAHRISWDGRDAAGRRTPSGTYVVRVRTDSASDAAVVSLVR